MSVRWDRGNGSRGASVHRAAALIVGAGLGLGWGEPGFAAPTEPAAAAVSPSRDFERSLFPAVFYSPETSVMFSGIALLSFYVDPDASLVDEAGRDRRSAIPSFVAYTLNNQFIVTSKPSIYLDGESYHCGGKVEATWFPDKLWDVGAASGESSEEDYTKRTLLAELRVTRRLSGGLRLGAQLRVANLAVDDVVAGGLLDRGALVGSDGGTEVGIGPALIWDLRDNDFAPRSGLYVEISSHLHLDALGSWTNQVHVVDARHYVDLGGHHVLAGQLYGKMTAGDVPFDSLAKLGGAARMRGFYEGRFRDRHMAIAQLDYRSPFWWRFAGALFVAVGGVARTLGGFSASDAQVAGGGGLRFMLSAKDRAALRLDVAATGSGEMGVYLQLGEAF